MKPILEVLVGKTLEQSLMEVMEEEELDTLRDHQAQVRPLHVLFLCHAHRPRSTRSCARLS